MEENLISVEEMKSKLEESGNKALWGAIERISNWKGRLAYRQIFFLAGGSLD
jgi:hypothetical protein